MINRAMLILLGFAVAMANTTGDEPERTKATGRIVEGKIVTAGGKPVRDAKILFGEGGRGMVFVEGATAETGADGRFRADLRNFPWSTTRIHALVLAPGYKPADRDVEAGAGTATANFELVPDAWKDIQVRMQDASGKAVAGVEVACSVGRVIWARYRTDGDGRFHMSLARDVPMLLAAAPKGARPIKAHLSRMSDEHPSITLPVLPPIRGRVVDTMGRPVPATAVGRWLTFAPDGIGEMLHFFCGAGALTDSGGNFEIAPALALGFGETRPSPTIGVLCFADPSYRSERWLLFNPNQPIRMALEVFDENRPTEPMTVTLKPSRRVRIPISRGFVMSKRKTQCSATFSICPRKDRPAWAFLFLDRALKPTEESGTEAKNTVLEEYLPEGTYELEAYLEDVESEKTLGEARGRIIVPPGDGPLELPPLAFGLTDWQKMAGKPAPEMDAIDLDTGRRTRLADFRGKVVLLDFWGYWCGVCNGNMPYLVELHRKFAGRPLVIVALHDQSVQSREAYDRKISVVRERLWGGRDLPFRVLLDRPDPDKPDDDIPEGSGTTVKRYGVDGFPSLFVIGPDGTMIGAVNHSDHDRLESMIREQLKKAEQAR